MTQAELRAFLRELLRAWWAVPICDQVYVKDELHYLHRATLDAYHSAAA